ncbi:MAG: lysozyme inhibitor LprI family protein [Chthoniobacterales bacterium]
MRLRGLTVVTLLVSLASPLCAAEPSAPILPEDWLPALTPSINSALGQLKKAETQSEMNARSREVADMTDAQLFIAYVRLYERLGASERKKLQAEQTRWLKQRAKAAREAVESKGGSLAPLEANNAEVTFTEKRLAELRVRLKAAPESAASDTGDEEPAPPKKKKKKSADED